MSDNRGKEFEHKLRADFIKSIPNSTIDRLYDSMNGFRGISNISDFIGYAYPNIFYIECKTHKGASIPFDQITQYDKLKYDNKEEIVGYLKKMYATNNDIIYKNERAKFKAVVNDIKESYEK